MLNEIRKIIGKRMFRKYHKDSAPILRKEREICAFQSATQPQVIGQNIESETAAENTDENENESAEFWDVLLELGGGPF